jgi:GTP-binding protein EngB required for normal cell division
MSIPITATASAGRLSQAAERLLPLLPPEVRPDLSAAVGRALDGRSRVLVLGETNRGKTSLVNSLFGSDLLPTGVLPLTSVATQVTVAEHLTMRARYYDGRETDIPPAQIADLVTEIGNPSNAKQVDRVMLTAPSHFLPGDTEVVDTPGTGSIHHANTAESSRARSTMDVAVLVLSADPPVSAAELGLVSDALRTASRAAAVINKADLVTADDLEKIVTFTERAITQAIGTQVPVFSMSLRGGSGRDPFVRWLAEQLWLHGAADTVYSTARAVRRAGGHLLDQLQVEDELLHEQGDRATGAVAALEQILERARVSAASAADTVGGEALRLRRRLDQEHDQRVRRAQIMARHTLAAPGEPGDTPEADADRRRTRVLERVHDDAASWFTMLASELELSLHRVADQTVERLRDDLAAARQAAESVLSLSLSEPAHPARAQPAKAPRLEVLPETAWHELVSSAIARHLPANIRRAQWRRRLTDWAETAAGQPFGRARATLQSWLEEANHVIERDLTTIWEANLAALERAVATVTERGKQNQAQTAGRFELLANRIEAVGKSNTELDALLATDNGHRKR